MAAGGVVRHASEWMPTLGLDFSLRMDGFAWLFAGMVSGVGGLVVVYARYYMAAEDPVPRFFAFLLAFMGSMMGVVLSAGYEFPMDIEIAVGDIGGPSAGMIFSPKGEGTSSTSSTRCSRSWG